ncbi:hypothetical protein SDC9_152747 [bioreactor metagenome]|uniref:Uncharacterized protein n=1 Tax=bioreactor metagenome TaxID=1076179 RepID=A0A645EVP2_9ZZZZ
MGVNPTRDPCEKGGRCKGQHPVKGEMNSRSLRCDVILPDGKDGSAVPGAHQGGHEHNRNNHDDIRHGKGGDPRYAAKALCTSRKSEIFNDDPYDFAEP